MKDLTELKLIGRGMELSKRGWWLPLVIWLAAGCAHPPPEGPRNGAENRPPPGAPPFLCGPMGALLAQSSGFQAKVQIDPDPSPEQPPRLAGELLGRGPKLLFAPSDKGREGKRAHEAGLSFLWDVQKNSGFILSETLQAYAPLPSAANVTDLRPGASQAAPTKVNGHPCHQQEVTAATADGQTASLQVWRAGDLNGFPVRMASATGPAPLTVNLSRIRLEPPPEEVFALPTGFTRYETAERMLEELMIRKRNLKKRPPEPPPGEGPTGEQVERPTAGPSGKQ